MSRDKQIEEMAKVLKGMDRLDEAKFGFYESYARAIYTAGYRKASEVALEVIGEVFSKLKLEFGDYGEDDFYYIERTLDRAEAELKKKYTEGGE